MSLIHEALQALEAMKAEFRALDLPYGSKAYARANEVSYRLRAALAAQPASQPDARLHAREAAAAIAAQQGEAAAHPDLVAIMDLADQYARSSASAHVEDLYGTSKSYTRECTKRANADRTALHNAIAALAAAPAVVAVEPVVAMTARQELTDEQIDAMWSRAFSDGTGRSMATVFARAIERACAESWGVTLVGIGG